MREREGEGIREGGRERERMSQQSRTNNLRIPDRDVGNLRHVDVIEDFYVNLIFFFLLPRN